MLYIQFLSCLGYFCQHLFANCTKASSDPIIMWPLILSCAVPFCHSIKHYRFGSIYDGRKQRYVLYQGMLHALSCCSCASQHHVLLTYSSNSALPAFYDIYLNTGGLWILKMEGQDTKCYISFNNHVEWCTSRMISKSQQPNEIPYILESNPHPNLIHTQFWQFLKTEKNVSLRF
jgi:hypothetical protein